MDRTASSGPVFRPEIFPMFQLRRALSIWSIRHKSRTAENAEDGLRNLGRKQGRNGISDLCVLCSTGPHKQVIVRKCLNPSCLPDRQAPALRRVWMNVVMAVLRNVRCNCGGGASRDLNPESILEESTVFNRYRGILMIWYQILRKVPQYRATFLGLRIASREEITIKVLFNVAAGCMITDSPDPFIQIPIRLICDISVVRNKLSAAVILRFTQLINRGVQLQIQPWSERSRSLKPTPALAAKSTEP